MAVPDVVAVGAVQQDGLACRQGHRSRNLRGSAQPVVQGQRGRGHLRQRAGNLHATLQPAHRSGPKARTRRVHAGPWAACRSRDGSSCSSRNHTGRLQGWVGLLGSVCVKGWSQSAVPAIIAAASSHMYHMGYMGTQLVPSKHPAPRVPGTNIRVHVARMQAWASPRPPPESPKGTWIQVPLSWPTSSACT